MLHKIRALIALFLLRCLFPRGMSGAQAVVLLPLQASAQQATDTLSLVDLLRTPQVVVDPAHPNRRALDLLRSLGSRSVLFPTGEFASLSSSARHELIQQALIAAFDGNNHAELATTFNLSLQQVYRLLEEAGLNPRNTL